MYFPYETEIFHVHFPECLSIYITAVDIYFSMITVVDVRINLQNNLHVMVDNKTFLVWWKKY